MPVSRTAHHQVDKGGQLDDEQVGSTAPDQGLASAAGSGAPCMRRERQARRDGGLVM